MKIIVVKNYEQLSERAADLIQEQIEQKADSVLGLATGSTPIGCYRELIVRSKAKQLSFAGVSTLNLDEYVGLAADHAQSYHYFMKQQLFDHLDIDQRRTYLPNGDATDLEQACRLYEEKIDEVGPPDLQVLGIGANGHIGFNEPGSSFSSFTHIVRLAESTRQANARFFSSIDDVPHEAITMGIRSILKSRKIVLLASGERKAEAIKRLLERKTDRQFPASSLCDHPDVTLITDEKAYKLVQQRG